MKIVERKKLLSAREWNEPLYARMDFSTRHSLNRLASHGTILPDFGKLSLACFRIRLRLVKD